MRILLVFLFLFSTLAAQDMALREIKTGDHLPDKESLKVFKGTEKKLILYLRSTDPKSVMFLKKLSASLKSIKGLKLYIVDTQNKKNERLEKTLGPLKVKIETLFDPNRIIYGDLGIIVMPTLLYVNERNVLHSLISGYQKNLNMFLDAHLKAFLKGDNVSNVYKEAEKKVKQSKITKMIKQAFLYLINSNFDLAEMLYNKILKEDPKNRDAQMGFGYSLILGNKLDEAQKFFSNFQDEKANKRIQLGIYLLKAMTDPDPQSLKMVSSLAQIEPRFFLLIFKAGEILEGAEMIGESRDVFKHAYRVLLRHHRRYK